MTTEIRLFGAHQNNLKNFDVSLPTGKLIVVTGVSGSGKSSLAFDTLYAEGQRRYVETFSPYARQFLDRMDKPQVDRIEGILPAIALDQTNPVRNSRSTVGTMTELNDHLKLLFAHNAQLYCRNCGAHVQRDSAESVMEQLAQRTAQIGDPRLLVTFPVTVPTNFTAEEVRDVLQQQGYTRLHSDTGASDSPDKAAPTQKTAATPRILHVVQDRFRFSTVEHSRAIEALTSACRHGTNYFSVHALDEAGQDTHVWRFSDRLHCANCDIEYQDPRPSSFSFNSPLGACEQCRGFGRVIGIDFGLVVPDTRKSLLEGAIKPWQTASYQECQADLERYGRKAGIPLSVPWRDLTPAQQTWVREGDPTFQGGQHAWKTQWYGIQRFFNWLETKTYKMHVRVLLSKYRCYTPCPACQGSRLKADTLLWRLGSKQDADSVLPPNDPHYKRFKPVHANWSIDQLNLLDGLCIHDLMLLPLERVRIFFDLYGADVAGTTRDAIAHSSTGTATHAATKLLLTEVHSRLKFLCDVGLNYLTLDRQSRTLSGGEVQRINLTTALGTSLVNTLFVLDEPSIGLHPRDIHRVVEVMQRLRHAGNTLVVVEHDPQILITADQIIDMGPGPGERGGHIVFQGTPAQLRATQTLTGDYLSNRLRVQAPRPLPVTHETPQLLLQGVNAHNLKDVTVTIPLGHLVCITGVSGSGKSTLIQDVLYPALRQRQGKPATVVGSFTQLLGAEHLTDVVLVDQTQIGKTTRSNPVSYVGAFDAIRKLFARAPLAQQRAYTAGMFSFNSGEGRCPSCHGTGFEHVDMQFLSDVYLRCPACEGKRFRPEILEVRVEHLGQHATIDDVLAMTVNEALTFFKGLRDVQQGLQPLAAVGLEYVRLGQPVPTLSGGEAQRLKLAGHLAEASRLGIALDNVAPKGSLFLFDEPTTGLHFDDIARLMQAFRQLLTAGHTLVIIEHNLDVIRAADWVIDLGPEGGDAGGKVVAAGTPNDLMAHPTSHTGAALRHDPTYLLSTQSPRMLAEPNVPYAVSALAAPVSDAIDIRNVREHNLKNISVNIPRNKFTVITGVSGSGKSTLAFDVLFNEGQRRYLESLNAYARAIVQPAGKPDVDAIFGIPPTVAIAQRTTRGGFKSTVATITEIYHFLRLIYVNLGVQISPYSGAPVVPQTAEQIVARLLQDYTGQHIGLLAPLITARKGFYTDLAKWAQRKGHTHLRVDGVFTPVDPWPRLSRYQEHTIELPIASMTVDPAQEDELRHAVQHALDAGQGALSVVWPLPPRDQALTAPLQQLHLSTTRTCPISGVSFPELTPRLFSYNSKHGWCPTCVGNGIVIPGVDATSQDEDENNQEDKEWTASDIDQAQVCPTCHGQRLNQVALAVHWHGRSIAQLANLSVSQAYAFFDNLVLTGREADIARDILQELRSRLHFMQQVGLGYLALDRAAPTLSGGEAQRLRLAAQLGANMQGVCYVLDEPTIGLHPRDNHILLNALEQLEKQGNTLVIVEHDEDTIRRADHIIDMGPGAGVRGGRVVAQGTLQDVIAAPESITGHYLAYPLHHPRHSRRPVTADVPAIEIHQAHRHNLRNISARFPLGRLTVVTGVSGSGKSTLVRNVLRNNLRLALAEGKFVKEQGCAALTGWQALSRILEVDQTPIGKTPRSCPSTYIGFWDTVRKQFAETREARLRGWTATRFSFNTGDGRCPLCDGQGQRTIEMSFLPDVKVPCDACNGMRFNADTLAIQLRGKHTGEVLALSVDDALLYFAAHPAIRRPLQLMQDVGLGYLTLGQPSPTLSGGEAQRIKLVTELAKTRSAADVTPPGRLAHPSHAHTCYLLDEPTVGLATADVEKLIDVLHRLVEAGNTVVIIEHNLAIMAEADWLLDLGPEGGPDGGQLVAQGPPEAIMAQSDRSHTGRVLAEFLTQ